MAPAPASDGILSVSALTSLIKGTLTEAYPAVWVKGELTGFKRHGSGHLYFSLKDEGAVLGCVMWKGRAGRLAFEPRDGLAVEAFGSITVYEPQGRYQLVAEELRPAGLGALLLALEELKRRLEAEGLFDPARKRPLPPFPRRVGLVTSPTGAAVRDLVKVLRTRWPAIGIVLAPVRVQGEGAAAEIAAAIERFDRYGGVDLLIVGRGGGSLEDLWAFNEEPVVRAIAACRLPVISAVGHEVDVTLADFAADVRAATPSNAAELAVPSRLEVGRRVGQWRERLERAARQGALDRRRRLETLTARYGFRRQEEALGHLQQRVDELLDRLEDAVRSALERAREWLEQIASRYGLREWPRLLEARRAELDDIREQLDAAAVQAALARRTRALALADRLRALSPRLVLERGYCLVRAPDGSLVRAAGGLTVGEMLTVEFARGEADARVERVRPGGMARDRKPVAGDAPDPASLSFEAAIERLQTIVEELEGGSLSLEDSIARYEEGVKLSRRLTQTLDEAEKRIERLAEGAGGEPVTAPMELEGEGPDEPKRPEAPGAAGGRSGRGGGDAAPGELPF